MCYTHVEQPMMVYHSVEEFNNNVKNAIIIHSLGTYLDFVKAHNIDLQYNSNNKYVDVRNKNVWIRTIDEYIPDVAEFSGEILYRLDNEGNKIPTDGCFIQLYFITPTPTRNIFYTSSGVHTVGMTKWQPTAAIRYCYSQESDPRRGQNRESIYNDRLQKVLRKRQPDVSMTKVVAAMMNPSSIYFLDFNGAVKAVMPWLKAADRGKLLQTESFKRTLMSIIKTFFPELAPAIRNKHTPEEMANKLQEAFDVAKEKKDSKAMVEVFNAILTTGYEENVIVNDNTGKIAGMPNPKQLKDGSTGMPTDDFLNSEPELTMSGIFPGSELSEEEVKKSYPASFVGLDEDEIANSLRDD